MIIFAQLLSLFSTAPSRCEHGFLGLVPWFHFLPKNEFDMPSCDINRSFNILPGQTASSHSDLPLILAAIIDDLLRIAAIVTVFMLLYGAAQYVMSQGSPDQASKAQSTMINALIGLAISLVAVAFVSFLGGKLG